jgi:hypothetical protein
VLRSNELANNNNNNNNNNNFSYFSMPITMARIKADGPIGTFFHSFGLFVFHRTFLFVTIPTPIIGLMSGSGIGGGFSSSSSGGGGSNNNSSSSGIRGIAVVVVVLEVVVAVVV